MPPVVTQGAVAGLVIQVGDHPNADRLWICQADIGTAKLVPVAPPGARLSTGKRMRGRRYRGQRSEGMLCSTDELGWTTDGPDEVAVLHDLTPGTPLRTGGAACGT